MNNDQPQEVQAATEPPKREMSIPEKQEFALNRIDALIETLNGWIIEGQRIGLTLGLAVEEVTLTEGPAAGTYFLVLLKQTLREIPEEAV
jgi:hypothetical protein